jgi:hypothetical protein
MNTLAIRGSELQSKLAAIELYHPSESIDKRDGLVKQAADIKIIADDFMLGVAVDLCAELRGLSKSTEESRTLLTGPVLDFKRRIDSIAKSFAAPCDVEYARLNRLIGPYQSEQRRLAEVAERKRQEELQRIEHERQRAEQADRERLAAIAKAEADAARAKADAENSFNRQQEKQAASDLAVANAERERLAQEARASTARLSDLGAQRLAAQRTVVKPSAPAGLAVKNVWLFEVTDIAKVYAANPSLCRVEVNVSAVNKLLSAGFRDIPGLRIWTESKSSVRT